MGCLKGMLADLCNQRQRTANGKSNKWDTGTMD